MPNTDNDVSIEEELNKDKVEPLGFKLKLYDVDLTDIEGIGVTTAKKLKDIGIREAVELAVCNSQELSELINCTQETARSYIISAAKLLRENELLDKEFMTGTEALKKRQELLRLTTGSKVLDTFLKGGIETKAITEFYGEFGSGKTQICHTLAINAQLSYQDKGFNSTVIYFDTEGTFRAERIKEMAESRQLNPEEILSRIYVSNIYNSAQLELYIRDLATYLKKYNNPKLIIVDSLTSHHRAEFLGRGTLSDRQQRLNSIMHKLVKVSEIFNIAVVVTNQVQSNPDGMFSGNPIKPVGGHIIGHSSTYRIYLRKSKTNRIATMVDSPYHEYGECRFTVTNSGVEDVEDE